jgi:uncharacterized protein DUF2460
MPTTFPFLKTGAVAQYPASTSISYSSRVIRFLDGSDQRYRDYSSPLHKWTLPLNLLDDAELSALEQFVVTQEGRFGSFSFGDPWTQVQYSSCSMNQEGLDYVLTQEARGAAGVVLQENRS